MSDSEKSSRPVNQKRKANAMDEDYQVKPNGPKQQN
jgi:hypothetical protein